MAKVTVKSSIIASVYYQPESKSLDVNFLDGHTRIFYQIPESVVQTLVTCDSPGTFYMSNIRGAYPQQ